MSTRLLLVEVGAELFALPVADVLEAVDAPVVAPLALLPRGVAGQCAHRERLLTVLDAGVLFGVPRAGADGRVDDESVAAKVRGTLLVIDADAERFGLLVNDVIDITEADAKAWRAVPATSAPDGRMLRALLALEQGLAALVDMDALRAAALSLLTTKVA